MTTKKEKETTELHTELVRALANDPHVQAETRAAAKELLDRLEPPKPEKTA